MSVVDDERARRICRRDGDEAVIRYKREEGRFLIVGEFTPVAGTMRVLTLSRRASSAVLKDLEDKLGIERP